MRFLALFTIGLLMVTACQDVRKQPRPKNLIPKEKMVDVLTEMALLQGARSYNKNLLEERGIVPREYLFDKYNIDSLQFLRSNDYYASQYKQYQDIYVQVKERLEGLKERYDSIREEEERKKDSLRKLRIRRDSLKQKKDSVPVPERAVEKIITPVSSDSLSAEITVKGEGSPT